ncbi:ABC transporter G family member 7-like [Coffea eugenioides]|uniref:ABC transporter G family member 7-like n=1 Tax=Coffea eugenioides TaxID=49369 RepID=UPI000F60C674|nr:ABC transporter G family member 7-like [Coffea eugenioides]
MKPFDASRYLGNSGVSFGAFNSLFVVEFIIFFFSYHSFLNFRYGFYLKVRVEKHDLVDSLLLLSFFSELQVRFLLKGASGEARPGRLLAIMGPSGSGKTTLLNILAGQVMASPRLHLSGLLEVNGQKISKRTYKFAYIRQEDLFFSQLTVRETLSLAAEMQLEEISSVEERDEYVNNLLFKLGLVSCADSRVGDAKVRGISGGEKKRLSLACELIASPSVIFADEPTTGILHIWTIVSY